MRQVMVQYRVKPELAAQNEALVRRVYDELAQTGPAGIRYATFALDDGVSFVHVASFDRDDGSNPLREVAAFREFQDTIGERCVEPPRAETLREIGSFGFRGAEAAQMSR